MESRETLDREFDQQLAEMKPYVLRLQHKTERQRCALWVKKLCEPTSGITGRKNRNSYSQLMLHLLKRGSLEGPFLHRPEEGVLPPLPSYTSIYFDESTAGSPFRIDEKGPVPDWVSGELTDATFRTTTTTSTDPLAVSSARPHSSFASELYSTENEYSESHTRRHLPFQFSDDDTTHNDDNSHTRNPVHTGQVGFLQGEGDFTQGTASHLISTVSTPAATSTTKFHDNEQLIKLHEKELEMKGKLLEAKFQEEKLRLQQKHDATVQKILDRKNAEIEEVKSHYRNKTKDHEESVGKLEKKIQTLLKEANQLKETKDRQIEELKLMNEETCQAKQSEFEKKFHDAIAEMEQEKFDMQKQHTRNIQQLLDDTNSRLEKMETEYGQQAVATSELIKELESRVQQLTQEAENTTQVRNTLERERMELQSQVERLQNDVVDYQNRYSVLEKEHHRAMEEHEQQLRSLKSKMEASMESIKQENSMAASKAADSMAELEQQITSLKQQLTEEEQHRLRQTRIYPKYISQELEQVHQQDKHHMEHLHDKKVRGLQKELDQLEQDWSKKHRKLEQTLREKEDELRRTTEQYQTQVSQSEKALEDFKSQVERNAGKMYEDMKKQMEKVEIDLDRSKQLREKQAQEFHKQLEDEKRRHLQEVTEMKITFEQEHSKLLHGFHAEKELMLSEREQEVDTIRDSLTREIDHSKSQARSKSEEDRRRISELEGQTQKLREEVVKANQLRKQQLVELGLLRDEEKTKMIHEHEQTLTRMNSQLEQQRLDLQKVHSGEMEEMLEKTSNRLREIEEDFSVRNQKSLETITELQDTIQQLRNDQLRMKEHHKQQGEDVAGRTEEEKKALKKHHANTVLNLQKEIEKNQNRARKAERRQAELEQEYEAKRLEQQLQYEQRMRGLMPADVQHELEDTISSLKTQVTMLQQRTLILQEELDQQQRCSDTSALTETSKRLTLAT